MAMLLKYGSKGQEVKRLQSLLGGLTVDGDFGTLTQSRLQSVQLGLGLNPDGVAGWKTQSALKMPIYCGVDVSRYQYVIEWPLVPHDQVQFAFIRATQGTTYVDSYFMPNRDGAWSAGIPAGFYHFAEVFKPWRDNLDNFCFAVQKLRSTDLPPVLDLENESIDATCTPAETRDWAQQWLETCQDRLGKRPLLYTGISFLKEHVDKGAGLSYYADLWASRWSTEEPEVLETQEWSKWSVWQYTNQGKIPGITKNTVDLDYMSSTYKY